MTLQEVRTTLQFTETEKFGFNKAKLGKGQGYSDVWYDLWLRDYENHDDESNDRIVTHIDVLKTIQKDQSVDLRLTPKRYMSDSGIETIKYKLSIIKEPEFVF